MADDTPEGFKWMLYCVSCDQKVCVKRSEFNKELICPNCKRSARIEFNFPIENEEDFKPSFSSIDYVRNLRKSFAEFSDEELISYRDNLDLVKHGPAVMVTLTHVLREFERRGLE